MIGAHDDHPRRALIGACVDEGAGPERPHLHVSLDVDFLDPSILALSARSTSTG